MKDWSKSNPPGNTEKETWNEESASKQGMGFRAVTSEKFKKSSLKKKGGEFLPWLGAIEKLLKIPTYQVIQVS